MSYSFRIEQAIRAATVLHKDQVRKGRTPYPYISHLIAVALIVGDYTDEEDTIITAFLHDTLEDTDYTEQELASDFGPKVASMVRTITEPLSKKGEKLPWKEEKKQYIKQLKKADEQTLIVVAADKLYNMRCMVEDYFDRPSEFISYFGGSLNDRLMVYQEISNILNRNLTNDVIHEFNNVFKQYKAFLEKVQDAIEVR